MNCDWVQGNITLYVYDELADDARYELEQHIARCPACRAEVEAERQFQATMTLLPEVEPSPNLLTASRMRLQEALETTEQAHGWRRFVIDPTHWLRRYKFSPALAAALLLVGFFAGAGTSYKMAIARMGTPAPVAQAPITAQPAAQPAAEASIAGIRAIAQEPGSNNVDIKYDTIVPQQTQGSLDDPRIQQLLLYAARNNNNSGVRMDSVDLLAQQKQSDEHVREVLIYSLRNDNNPGVRLKALEGLASYVGTDVRVRNAVLDALMNDDNPGVRVQALQLVRPVAADSNVRAVIEHLAASDRNDSIRRQSQTMLASMPRVD